MAEEIEFEVSDIRDAVQQFEQLEEAMLTAADSADRMNRTNKELVDKLDDVEGEAEDAGESAEQASSSFSGWQGTLTAFSTTATAVFEGLDLGISVIEGVTSAVETSIGSFKGWVETNRQFISQLNTQARQTGLSVDKFQLLSESMRQLKVDQETTTDALFTFNEAVGLAVKGEKRFKEAFEDLGISLKDEQGNIRGTQELFMETVRVLGDMESQSKRAALAGELMGGDVARKMAPAFGRLADQVEETRGELIGLDDSEKTIADLNAEMSLLTTNLSQANARVFQPVAEDLARIIDETNEWIGANEGVIESVGRLTDAGFEGFLEGIGLDAGNVDETLNSVKETIENIDQKTIEELLRNIGKTASNTAELASSLTGLDSESIKEDLDQIASGFEGVAEAIEDLEKQGILTTAGEVSEIVIRSASGQSVEESRKSVEENFSVGRAAGRAASKSISEPFETVTGTFGFYRDLFRGDVSGQLEHGVESLTAPLETITAPSEAIFEEMKRQLERNNKEIEKVNENLESDNSSSSNNQNTDDQISVIIRELQDVKRQVERNAGSRSALG